MDSPVLSNLQAISRTIIPSMSSAPTQVKRQVSKPNLSEDFWLSQARLSVEVSARCSILRSNQLYTQCTPPSLLLEPLAAKRNLLLASWVWQRLSRSSMTPTSNLCRHPWTTASLSQAWSILKGSNHRCKMLQPKTQLAMTKRLMNCLTWSRIC